MSDPNLNSLREFFLQDIWLLDIFGNPATTASFVFVPCAADFSFGKPQFKSANIDLTDCPTIVSHVSEDGEDIDFEEATILWLRGRIAKIFGVQTPFSQGLTDLFQMAFVIGDKQFQPAQIFMLAIVGGQIGDYDGLEMDFAFHFNSQSKPAWRKLAIAEFVGLLLEKPDETSEYFDYFSDGSGVTMIEFQRDAANLMMKSGVLVSDDFDEEVDPHLGNGYFSSRECIDCNGIGEEYIKYPIRQTCETCKGSGRVNW